MTEGTVLMRNVKVKWINFKKRNKKNEVVEFLVDEVRFAPGIDRKEELKNRLMMYFLPFIVAVSVFGASISCCDVNFNEFTFLMAVLLLHTGIHYIVYDYSAKGRRTGISVMIIAYVAVVVALSKFLKEGLLYIVDDYLTVLNEHKDSDFSLDYKMTYNRHTVVFLFLVVVMAFMLFLYNYIIVCYTNLTLFTLFSVSWFALPLAAGVHPKDSYFLVYVVTLVMVRATGGFSRKRVNPSRKNKAGTYKKFTDSPVCKIMYSMMVVFIPVLIIAYISVPKKLHNNDYLIERHEKAEYNLKTAVKEKEEKYKIESELIDKFLGVDDLRIGDAKEERRNHSESSLSKYIEGLSDVFNKQNQALLDEIQKKYISGAKSFFNGYDHGNLNNNINSSNLNTDKVYDFAFEDTGYDMKSVYLKNYNSVSYSGGTWTDKDVMPDYELDVDFEEIYKEQFNEFTERDDEYNETSGRRKIMISQVSADASDNITKYIVADEIFPTKEGNKMSVTYTEPNVNALLGVAMPGGVEDAVNYMKDTLWWGNDSCNSWLIGSFVWYLYDNYVEVPKEVEEVAQYARDGFKYKDYYAKEYIDSCILQMRLNMNEQMDDEYGAWVDYNDEYYEIDNYNEYALAAIKHVQDILSSGYTYTLSPKKTKGTDPVYDFVFNTHEGYCMHFASAATIMLRGLGVPARYVEGYMIDEKTLNDALKAGTKEIDGKEMASTGIYGTNAHAWVEVFIDNLGWVPVEMTLGSSATGESFYNESNNYRETVEESRAQAASANKPDKKDDDTQETKKEDESAVKNNDGSDSTNNKGKLVAAMKKIFKIASIPLMITLCMGVAVYYVRRKRKARLRKIATSKGAYRFITKRLIKAADKAGVDMNGNNHYLDIASVFAVKDECMEDEDAIKFMEVLRHATYSKDGVTVEDVECLKDIYNRYMSKVREGRNTLSVFFHEKILGEIASV